MQTGEEMKKNKADDFGRDGEREIVAGHTWSLNLPGKNQLNNTIPFVIFNITTKYTIENSRAIELTRP